MRGEGGVVALAEHSLEEAKAVLRVMYGPGDPAGWEVKKALAALAAADEVRAREQAAKAQPTRINPKEKQQ